MAPCKASRTKLTLNTEICGLLFREGCHLTPNTHPPSRPFDPLGSRPPTPRRRNGRGPNLTSGAIVSAQDRAQ
eukprot:5743197-Pyramimonas_sp.AAC.1